MNQDKRFFSGFDCDFGTQQLAPLTRRGGSLLKKKVFGKVAESKFVDMLLLLCEFGLLTT